MPIDVRSVGMLKLFGPCCNSLSDEIGEMVCGMMCCFFFFVNAVLRVVECGLLFRWIGMRTFQIVLGGGILLGADMRLNYE